MTIILHNIRSGNMFTYAVYILQVFSNFAFFFANLAIKQNITLGYICKDVNSGYTNYIICISWIKLNPFGSISEVDCCQIIFVFPFRSLLSGIEILCPYCSYEKIVDIIICLGDIQLNLLCLLIFLCLLSTITYRPVSIGINVDPVCIDNVTVTNIICGSYILHL